MCTAKKNVSKFNQYCKIVRCHFYFDEKERLKNGKKNMLKKQLW